MKPLDPPYQHGELICTLSSPPRRDGTSTPMSHRLLLLKTEPVLLNVLDIFRSTATVDPKTFIGPRPLSFNSNLQIPCDCIHLSCIL